MQVVMNYQDLQFIDKVKECHTFLGCESKDLFIITKRGNTVYLDKSAERIIDKKYINISSDETTNILYYCQTPNGLRYVRIHDGDNQFVINKADYSRFIRYCYQLKQKDFKKNKINKPILSAEVERIIKEEIFDFFVHAQDAEKCGVKLTKGICLFGKPGLGKTSILKWVNFLAKTRKLTYECVTGAALQDAMGKDALEHLMHKANIVCFDDVDIAIFDRAAKGGYANFLLSAMDGPGTIVKKPILRIFTTNERLENVDDAFKRPGRIDKFLEISQPDANLRRKFVESWHQLILSHLTSSDIDYIVSKTENVSFAWMESIKSELFKQIINKSVSVAKAIEDGKRIEITKSKSLGFGVKT